MDLDVSAADSFPRCRVNPCSAERAHHAFYLRSDCAGTRAAVMGEHLQVRLKDARLSTRWPITKRCKLPHFFSSLYLTSVSCFFFFSVLCVHSVSRSFSHYRAGATLPFTSRCLICGSHRPSSRYRLLIISLSISRPCPSPPLPFKRSPLETCSYFLTPFPFGRINVTDA